MKRFLGLAAEPEMTPFSILERIDVGETLYSPATITTNGTFSILERIDVGETFFLLVSFLVSFLDFQYPRTDRRG